MYENATRTKPLARRTLRVCGPKRFSKLGDCAGRTRPVPGRRTCKRSPSGEIPAAHIVQYANLSANDHTAGLMDSETRPQVIHSKEKLLSP